jgi:TUP1-like enhancer of split
MVNKIIHLAVKKITHKSDIRSLMVNHYIGGRSKKIENSDWFKDYQSDFDVFVSESGDPILKLDVTTYLVYNKNFDCWSQATDESVTQSFSLQSNKVSDTSKPILRNLAFEQQTEKLLTDLAGHSDISQLLATAEQSQANSNILARIEEDMLYCIETNNKNRYNESLKNYIIELANHKQLEKLKYFLVVTLMSDTNSKERDFLTRLGVKPDIIVANALKILEKIEYCRNLVEELRQAMELSKY